MTPLGSPALEADCQERTEKRPLALNPFPLSADSAIIP